MSQEGKVTNGGVLDKKVAEISGNAGSIFEHTDLTLQKRYNLTLECFIEVLDEQIKTVNNLRKDLSPYPDSKGIKGELKGCR